MLATFFNNMELQEQAKGFVKNTFTNIVADLPKGINAIFIQLYKEITGSEPECSGCGKALTSYDEIVQFSLTGILKKPKAMTTVFRLKPGVQAYSRTLGTYLVNDTPSITIPNCLHFIGESESHKNYFELMPENVDEQVTQWQNGIHPDHPKMRRAQIDSVHITAEKEPLAELPKEALKSEVKADHPKNKKR